MRSTVTGSEGLLKQAYGPFEWVAGGGGGLGPHGFKEHLLQEFCSGMVSQTMVKENQLGLYYPYCTNKLDWIKFRLMDLKTKFSLASELRG